MRRSGSDATVAASVRSGPWEGLWDGAGALKRRTGNAGGRHGILTRPGEIGAKPPPPPGQAPAQARMSSRLPISSSCVRMLRRLAL